MWFRPRPSFPLRGKDLNKMAALYGVQRRWFESDRRLRDRLLSVMQGIPTRRRGESDATFRRRVVQNTEQRRIAVAKFITGSDT